MSIHLRTAIRKAVAEVLRGSPPNRLSVYTTRRIPLPAELLPAILVYTLTEDTAVETMAPPRHLSRDLELVVEAVAQDNDAIDDVLDALATEIETRLGAAINNATSPLRQLVRAGFLQRTEMSLRPPQSPDEAGTGHMVLTYRVNYRTRGDDPALIN